ncbi:uncharacterized protein LOC129958928 [Argiope bruennichi]|uniref:Uncharacterized protein n=1 Tax=Argiope bruennichi TaxID=94029 RepID=A0A8T0F1X1_ARGBR|nr:uncharacterized protein LOC129958928 [Argiope bruennichi]KAF8785117.1 hypothetical protein HNY73_010704 [Argiope bruennichi]
MDVKDDKQFEIKEEEICQGHTVCYDFSVNNLSAKQTWLFKKTFQTDCKILPTSWLFEMLFQYLPDNGNASCYLTVSRNDTIDIPVKAFIWLRFSTANGQPFFILPKILTSYRMLPNDEIKESIVEILPFPEVGTSLNQELIVAVVIRIRHCHSESEEMIP